MTRETHRDPEAGQSTSMEDDLVHWGKVIALETHGRRSGSIRRVTVGFVEAADGSLSVAASDATTNWALNLMAEPRCSVERDGIRRAYRAERLRGPDHSAAISALIVKYGTPAERLGGGPSFRLTPDGDAVEA